MTLKKIGIIHGMERTFPEAFIERINSRRLPGIVAEELHLGGTAVDETQQYAVIVDRISHEIPYYRSHLKLAALNGTTVINNPFWWSADDKFFGTALAQRLGIAVPKTILLPNRSYIPGVTDRSLVNLRHPLDWEAMLRYVGLPAILKPAQGGGGKDVTKVRSLQELWDAYNKSGELNMILQECIEWDHYVRCLCVGQTHILPIKWHPPFGRPMGQYFVDHSHMSAELGRRVVGDAKKLNQALGYDMNTVEFAVRDGVPYAIDFTNPAPDFDRNSITPHYFETIVEWMTDLAIRKATEATLPQANLRWSSLMGWTEPTPAAPARTAAPAPAAAKQKAPAPAQKPAAAPAQKKAPAPPRKTAPKPVAKATPPAVSAAKPLATPAAPAPKPAAAPAPVASKPAGVISSAGKNNGSNVRPKELVTAAAPAPRPPAKAVKSAPAPKKKGK